MRLKSKETLRALMKQQGFTQERLGRYAGVHRSFIGHLLSEYKTSCTTETADRIAEALGVPTTALFDPRTSADIGQIADRQRTKSSAGCAA